MTPYDDSTADLRAPDFEYWKRQIKCQYACPVNTDARGYVRAIAEGKDELAYLIARGPNPLASICGRVCGAPCEQACRRGDYDAPVSIRALKRFVCDQFGPEAREDRGHGLIEFLKRAASEGVNLDCAGKNELLPLLQSLTNGNIPLVGNKSVGIVGSGPAGLSAAHDLALLGFSVTMYESEKTLGGMLTLGIPEYRLPRDVVRAEVEALTELGIIGITNCRIGRDVEFVELRNRHDALILAVGAQRSRKLSIPGADADGVIGGVEFLRNVALGNPTRLGERVVVIGGGNVAYDVGRTVLRQIANDAARTARRSEGVAQVYLCSLESLDEMPADDIEIIEGEEEGVIRRNSIGPTEIIKSVSGHVTGIRFRKCVRVFDEKKRFDPRFDDTELTEIDCENVLITVGQSFDLSFIDPKWDGLTMNEFGAIQCNPETGVTSDPNTFVAGDLAYGPKLLIHAVASGKAVARTIYEKFTGRNITQKDVELHFPLPSYERERGYEVQSRLAPRTLPVSERIVQHAKSVELGFTREQAQVEAKRCFDCGVNTIFDGERCILCGGCVDVCPQRCLHIIPTERIQGELGLDEASSDTNAFAIVKDETVCIRCALCADRCPTGAITMERFCFKEVLQW